MELIAQENFKGQWGEGRASQIGGSTCTDLIVAESWAWARTAWALEGLGKTGRRSSWRSWGLIRTCPSDEREAVQKKTFTKWVNSHLARVGCHIGDLYTDLRDGFVLTRLLEVLSGEQLVRGPEGLGKGGQPGVLGWATTGPG